MGVRQTDTLVKMLPEDAFVRRFPSGVASVQALLVEALVYCADAVEASYDAIKLAALTHGERITQAMNRSTRVRMFVDAWTIVDCVHVARQALQALDYQTPRSTEFRKRYEVAKQLRDKMDHVANQAQNLANRRDQPPLLGMISYSYEDLEQDGTEFRLVGGTIIGISLGQIRTRSTMDTVNPPSLPTPVVYADEFARFGHVAHGFQLSAFDPSLVLPLETAANDLTALLEGLNDRASRLVPTQMQQHAATHGLELEDLMQPSGGDLDVWIKFERTQ